MIKLQEMKEKITQKSCLISATVTSLTTASLMPIAFAEGEGEGEGGGGDVIPELNYQNIDGVSGIMSNIGGYILTLFRYVGIFLLIWAAAQLFLAFKNEDADSKSKAMMMLIVAVLMVMIKSVVNGVIRAANTAS